MLAYSRQKKIKMKQLTAEKNTKDGVVLAIEAHGELERLHDLL